MLAGLISQEQVYSTQRITALLDMFQQMYTVLVLVLPYAVHTMDYGLQTKVSTFHGSLSGTTLVRQANLGARLCVLYLMQVEI